MTRLRMFLIAALVGAMTTAGTAAYAIPVPPNDGPPVGSPPPPVTPAKVVEVGSPVWQFLLVAVAAAVIAIVVEHLVARSRHVPQAATHPA